MRIAVALSLLVSGLKQSDNTVTLWLVDLDSKEATDRPETPAPTTATDSPAGTAEAILSSTSLFSSNSVLLRIYHTVGRSLLPTLNFHETISRRMVIESWSRAYDVLLEDTFGPLFTVYANPEVWFTIHMHGFPTHCRPFCRWGPILVSKLEVILIRGAISCTNERRPRGESFSRQ